MREFKKYIAALVLSLLSITAFAAEPAGFDNELSAKEVCPALRALSIDSDSKFAGKVSAYICDEDLSIMILTSVYDVRKNNFIDWTLQSFGMSEYVDKGNNGASLTSIIHTYNLVFLFPFVCIAIWEFALTLYKKSKGELSAGEGGKVYTFITIRWVIRLYLMMGGFVAVVLVSIPITAFSNSMALNTALTRANYAVTLPSATQKEKYQNDESAVKYFQIHAANFRTKQAIINRNATIMASSSWFGKFDSSRSKADVLEQFETKGGYDFVASTDNTFDFQFSLKTLAFGAPGLIYDWITSIDYAYQFDFVKSMPDSFDMRNKLGQPSTIGSISIKNNPSADLVDTRTKESNGQELKDILANAANSSAVGMQPLASRVKSIYDQIYPSILAGTNDYMKLDFSATQDSVKESGITMFKSVDESIKDLSKNGLVRAEVGGKAFANFLAAQLGFEKTKSIEGIDKTLIEQAVIDFWQVDCSRFYKANEAERKYIAKLNAYSGSWADARDIWSNITWKCAYVKDGKVIALGFDEETQGEQIQKAAANAKATIEALKIYFGVVLAGTKEALNASVARNNQSVVEMLKMNIYGYTSIGAQIAKVVDVNAISSKLTDSMNNAVDISYKNALEENNTYIDEDAVFGNATNEDGEDSTEQKTALKKLFGYPMTAYFFNTGSTVKNGSLTQLKASHVNNERGYLQEKVDKIFQDMILGDLNSWGKFALQLNPDLSIDAGLQECSNNPSVCDARPVVSLYEFTVTGNRILFNKGMQGIAVVQVIRALGSFADLGEVAGQMGGVGKDTAALGKLGGALWKGAFKLVEAAANALYPMFLLMAGVGFSGGYIMPAMLTVAPLAIPLSYLIGLTVCLLLIPLTIIKDTVSGNNQAEKKLITKLVLVSSTSLFYVIGMFLTITALTAIPVGQIGRFVMMSNLGAESSTISVIVQYIIMYVSMISVMQISIKMGQEVAERVAGFFEVSLNISAADPTAKASNLLASGMLVDKFGSMTTSLSQATEHSIRQRLDSTLKEMQKRKMPIEPMDVNVDKTAAMPASRQPETPFSDEAKQQASDNKKQNAEQDMYAIGKRFKLDEETNEVVAVKKPESTGDKPNDEGDDKTKD